MNKFKQMIMTMNRFRLLLATICALAVTALSGAYAAQEPAAPEKTAQDAIANQKSAEQAAKARAMKDAALKRRQDAQKFLNEHSTGYQPGTSGAAPSNTGTGGTK